MSLVALTEVGVVPVTVVTAVTVRWVNVTKGPKTVIKMKEMSLTIVTVIVVTVPLVTVT